MILNPSTSTERARRIVSITQRYRRNIERTLGTTMGANGRFSPSANTQVSRRQYMGLANG